MNKIILLLIFSFIVGCSPNKTTMQTPYVEQQEQNDNNGFKFGPQLDFGPRYTFGKGFQFGPTLDMGPHIGF